MKKKIIGLAVVLCIFAACMSVTAIAETGTKYGDYLYYEVNSDNTEITITDCDLSATDIVIPNEINGLPVTKIDYSAFYNCSNLSDITIPNSITSIGNYAFKYCTNLTNITIPDSVTNIGWEAFAYCRSLTSIAIPNGVTVIENSTFRYCQSLTNIIIPETLTSIGGYAFENTGYYNDDSNWENGVLYIGKFLIKANDNNLPSNYTVKSGTMSICSAAFWFCDDLISITIPDSVTNIEGSAFYCCRSLKSVIIPNSITSIGGSAFYGCNSLTDVTIPNSVTSIGYEAFKDTGYYNDDSNWEDGVLYIDKYLIQANYNKLSSCYTIRNGTTLICDCAFLDCNKLNCIIMPDSITNIGRGITEYCGNLTDIYYSGTEEEWQEINIGDYNEDLKNAVIHYNSTELPIPTINKPNILHKQNGTYVVTVPVSNVPYASELICVLYSKDIISGVNSKMITSSDDSIEIIFNADNADTAKIFLWDSLNEMKPICNAKSFTIDKE